jgi:hypothetical protein
VAGSIFSAHQARAQRAAQPVLQPRGVVGRGGKTIAQVAQLGTLELGVHDHPAHLGRCLGVDACLHAFDELLEHRLLDGFLQHLVQHDELQVARQRQFGADAQLVPQHIGPLRRAPFQPPGHVVAAAVDDDTLGFARRADLQLRRTRPFLQGGHVDAGRALLRIGPAAGQPTLQTFEHGLECNACAATGSARRVSR